MKKFILLFSVSILIVFSSCETDDSNPATPSNGTIHGKVTNITGDTVIVNANVSTIPATSSVSTNSSGDYTINYVLPGTYTVTAAKGGYNSGNVSVNVISGKTTTANIQMSIQTGTVLPTQGLVAYYPFNGNANDESGNGNNGTVYGAALTSDRFANANKAYNFDGSDFIEILNSSTIHLKPGSFTLTSWVNFSIYNLDNLIISKHMYGYRSGYGLGIFQNHAKFFVDSGYTSNGIVTLETYADDNWHFIVGAYDGTTQILYVDGVQKTSQRAAYIITNASNICIGNSVKNGGNYAGYFKGKIDDVRIYSRVLTNSEIQQLYHEGGW